MLLGGVAREVERESEGVVQAEGVVAGDDAASARVVQHFAKQARSLLERAGELLGLGTDDILNRRALGCDLGIGVAVAVGHHLHQAHEARGLKAQIGTLAHGATDDAAQDVIAALVARTHAVGGEEGHGTAVVGQHAHGAVDTRVGVVGAARHLLGPPDERPEAVGLEHRRLVLQDRREALEAGAGVDVLGRKGGERAVLRPVVLHEHEVPELKKPVGTGDRAAVRAETGPTVEVQLGVGATGACGTGLPEVVGLAQALDAVARDAQLDPALERLVVGRHPVHALEDGDPDLLGVEVQHLGAELEAEADGVVLEVVAD